MKSGNLAMFYAWLSLALKILSAKDFGIPDGKYQFRQLRSYKWRYTTDGPDGEYNELSLIPVEWEYEGNIYSICKSAGSKNPDWSPEATTVLFSFHCSQGTIPSGSENLDYNIFINNLSFTFDANWYLTFDFLLSSKLQYKLTTDISWTDFPLINDSEGPFFKIDQTIPQHIINGIPVYDSGIDVNNSKISNAAYPENDTDVATKKFVLDVNSNDFIEYFSNTVDPVLGGINYILDSIIPSPGTITSDDVIGTAQNIFNHITPIDKPINRLAKGTYFIYAHLKKTLTFLIGTKVINVYFELWQSDNEGTDVTLISTSGTTLLTTSDVLYTIPLTITDDNTFIRLKLKCFANLISGSFTGTVTLTLGSSNTSFVSIRVNDAVFVNKTQKVNGVALEGDILIKAIDPDAFHKSESNEITDLPEIDSIIDSTPFLCENDSGNKVKSIWSLIKSTFKTYFDSIYAPIHEALYVDTEKSTTPCSDNSDYTGSTGTKFFVLFTLPSDYKYYQITGIEWKNGTSVAGNILSGIVIVDADPPTAVNSPHVLASILVAQAGENAVQRNSLVTPNLISSGTKLGAYIQNSDSGAHLRYLAGQSNIKRIKTVAYTTTVSYVDNTAFSSSTNLMYIKIYYKGIN